MRNKLTDELAVCGFNAVAALGERHPETINRLFLRVDRLKSFTKVCKQLAERKRPYKLCEDEELERICKSPHHQGVVAMIVEPVIPGLTPEELEGWAGGGQTGLLLSSVGNDLNLGAIARSAAFFNARYIVLSGEDSDARLSTAAYRSAEGGMEAILVRQVHKPAAFVKDASRLLLTIGADHRSRLRIKDLPLIAKENRQGTEKRPGILLVMGNEETGLPRAIKENCRYLLRIPGTGFPESLNVAQAAAILLHAAFEI
ncbi:MAG: RNA methyltransferase [Spirochaetaceae bacterium]|jgi:TrmH RNA methyltransferase|nr:RNA methyltransferase [Spirochaetaceae bacterium]